MRHYPTPAPRLSSTNSFSTLERLLFGVAIILLIVGIGGYIWQRHHQTNGPAQGGTYVEGVIINSPTKVESIVSELTNVGLTYRDSDDSIKPALAQSWTVSSDNKDYSFKLKSGYSATQLLAIIKTAQTDWTGITITAPDASTLDFKLSQPLNSFLATTTDQLFPFGPYKVAKQDSKDIILSPNSRFPLAQPFIEKFEIRSYDTVTQLASAASNGDIDGSADLTAAPANWQTYTINLPRYYILFFNTARPAFATVAERQRVISATDGPPVTYTLVTTQSVTTTTLAANLAKTLAAKHITLKIQKKDSATFQKTDLAKRDYDLLLYGVDYGSFRDYYPFWDSTQATPPGLNVSNYKNKDLDTLLEQARQTNDITQHNSLNSQIEAYLQTNALQQIVSQESVSFWLKSSIKGVKYGTIDAAADRFTLVWQWHIQ